MRWFVFDNLFIACCAVGLVQVTQAALGLGLQFTALDVFVFCGTVAVYNLHAGVSLVPEQSLTSALRHLVSVSSALPARILILAAAIGMACSFFFLNPMQQVASIVMALVTLAYTFPLLRVNKNPRRVREIYLVKIMVIGFVWSLATVIFPALPFPISWPAITLLFLQRWFFVMAITVPFEIRDMEQEKRWGNKTLPVAIGIRQSKGVALVLLLLYEVALGIHFYVLQAIEPSVAAALALSALPAAAVIMGTTTQRGNFYYKFFVDGTMLLQYLFVILVDSPLC